MREVETFANGRHRFDVSDGGAPGAGAVVLLHGFPEDRGCWTEVAGRLQHAGYRTLAPDQRGYSPLARPPRRRDYRIEVLAGDVLALADQAGLDAFDVVGHDWGAVVGWYLAAHFPERVKSLAALSVPHPQAFVRALAGPQLVHSWYVAFFQLPRLPEVVLTSGGGRRLEAALRASGLSAGPAARYGRRAAERGALAGPLNWYRALPWGRPRRLPAPGCPVLMVWGDGDRFVTRRAVQRCAEHVKGRYRLEVLPGCSHWLPEDEAGRVAELVLAHLAPAGVRR